MAGASASILREGAANVASGGDWGRGWLTSARRGQCLQAHTGPSWVGGLLSGSDTIHHCAAAAPQQFCVCADGAVQCSAVPVPAPDGSLLSLLSCRSQADALVHCMPSVRSDIVQKPHLPRVRHGCRGVVRSQALQDIITDPNRQLQPHIKHLQTVSDPRMVASGCSRIQPPNPRPATCVASATRLTALCSCPQCTHWVLAVRSSQQPAALFRHSPLCQRQPLKP